MTSGDTIEAELMYPTYQAVLRDDRIEWTGTGPVAIPAGTPLPCHVTILSELPAGQTGDERKARRMAAVARALARGGVTSIPDPLAWEREQRADRPLPGRE